MKRVETKDNELLNNKTKPDDQYSPNNKGRWLRKMIIMNNSIAWRAINYNEQYPNMLVNFFQSYKPVKNKKDKATGLVTQVAGDYPTMARFRYIHKIPKSTWDYWVKHYPELKEAVEIIKDKWEDILINNWLKGKYNAQVVKQVWMNEHWRTEKKETTTKQEMLTDEQKKKMFDEYMRQMTQKGEILDWDALNNNK